MLGLHCAQGSFAQHSETGEERDARMSQKFQDIYELIECSDHWMHIRFFSKQARAKTALKISKSWNSYHKSGHLHKEELLWTRKSRTLQLLSGVPGIIRFITASLAHWLSSGVFLEHDWEDCCHRCIWTLHTGRLTLSKSIFDSKVSGMWIICSFY